MLSIPDALETIWVLLDVADMPAEGHGEEQMMSSNEKGQFPGVEVARNRQRNSGTRGMVSIAQRQRISIGRLRGLMACNLFWRGRITRFVAPPATLGNDSAWRDQGRFPGAGRAYVRWPATLNGKSFLPWRSDTRRACLRVYIECVSL